MPTAASTGSSLPGARVALRGQHCPAPRFVTVVPADAEDAAGKVAGRSAWHWPVRAVAPRDGTRPDTVAGPEVPASLGRR